MAKEVIKPEVPAMETVEAPDNAEEIIARRNREMVAVNLPLEGAQGETAMFVALNGKTWLVPRGKTTYVPRIIADEIRYKMRAQREAREFNEQAAKNANAAPLAR